MGSGKEPAVFLRKNHRTEEPSAWIPSLSLEGPSPLPPLAASQESDGGPSMCNDQGLVRFQYKWT